MTRRAELIESFYDTLGDLGVTEAAGRVTRLFGLYDQPYRAYHNLGHVAGVVEAMASCRPAARAAALYHDAIYVPGHPDNELASAVLAQSELYEASEVSLARVFSLIMVTKTHHPTDPSDLEVCALVDADLAGLASDEYGENRERVRREFGALSEERWRVGRTAFIEGFLARERIFWLPEHEGWEAAARENLRSELAALGVEDPQPRPM